MTGVPHDTAAERIVLGSMMLDQAVIDPVSQILTAESFYNPVHSAVFRAILAAFIDGMPTEPVAISQRTSDAVTLLGMVQAVPTSVQALYYTGIVRDRALSRGLMMALTRGQDRARSLDDPRIALEAAQADLDALSMPANGAGDPLRMSEIATDALNAMEAASQPGGQSGSVPTGLIDLDRLLNGGLRPGQVIVVAGRPGMGKSVEARGIARAAAIHHKLPTVLFTMEMTAVEVFHCLLSAELRIPLSAITSGELSDNDWIRIARFVGDTSDVPLFIDDTAGITVAEIRAKALRMRRSHGLSLLIVDYLQLVSVSNGKENRQVAVAEMTRAFKMLAQQLNIPIVLVAQLNRGPEQRTDKRPQLSDLRESGSLENDANVVIFVHRDDYYEKASPRAGEADLIIAKHRSGATDTITVASQLHHSRFVDMAIV